MNACLPRMKDATIQATVEEEHVDVSSSAGKKRPRSDLPQEHGPAGATPTEYSVVWETTTTAILTVHRPAWICFQGRGALELLTSEVHVFVQGYRLTPGTVLRFESPPWGDSLVTLTDITEGSMLRISSILSDGCTDQHMPTFKILYGTDMDKMRPTIPITSWTAMFPAIVENSRTVLSDPKEESAGFIVIFTGAAGVGKSTCLRMCYNLLLQHHSKVAVLDGNPATNGMLQLHIGDSPAGMKPYSEPLDGDSQLVAGHFFGYNSPRWDPQVYLHCLSSLIDVYLKHHVAMPLLIDTDGWLAKELGFETLKSFVFDVVGEPDHVVQIQGETASKKFDLTDSIPNSQLVKLHSVSCYRAIDEARQAFLPQRIAKSVRLVCSILPAVQALVQTHGKVTIDQQGFDDPLCCVAEAFANEYPLVASLDKLSILPKGTPLASLKGALVGLCCKGDDGQVALYGTPLLTCVGVGVVRAIDLDKGLLFLLTSLPNPPTILVIARNFKLPLECSFRGVCSSTFSGKSFDDCTILGSEPMSSRSLDRKGLLNAKRQRYG